MRKKEKQKVGEIYKRLSSEKDDNSHRADIEGYYGEFSLAVSQDENDYIKGANLEIRASNVSERNQEYDFWFEVKNGDVYLRISDAYDTILEECSIREIVKNQRLKKAIRIIGQNLSGE